MVALCTVLALVALGGSIAAVNGLAARPGRRSIGGLLADRRTIEDLRGYWPKQSDDPTGITTYLNM